MSEPSFTQIDISAQTDELGESDEIARVFKAREGGVSFFINPGPIKDPEVFGKMLVEMMRHGAIAYANKMDSTAQEAFKAISEGFSAQIEDAKKRTEGDA